MVYQNNMPQQQQQQPVMNPYMVQMAPPQQYPQVQMMNPTGAVSIPMAQLQQCNSITHSNFYIRNKTSAGLIELNE